MKYGIWNTVYHIEYGKWNMELGVRSSEYLIAKQIAGHLSSWIVSYELDSNANANMNANGEFE